MSAPVQNGSAKGAAKPTDKKVLKILMLHGKVYVAFDIWQPN